MCRRQLLDYVWLFDLLKLYGGHVYGNPGIYL